MEPLQVRDASISGLLSFPTGIRFGAEGKGCRELLWNEKGKSLVSLGGGMLGDFGGRGGFWLWAVGGRGSAMVISISSDQVSVVGVCVGFTPLLGT